MSRHIVECGYWYYVYGLSCRRKHNVRKPGHGRQLVHAMPHLPQDPRIQSGMRGTVEILVFVSLVRLLQDGYRVWMSTNGITLCNVREGIMQPCYILRLSCVSGAYSGMIWKKTIISWTTKYRYGTTWSTAYRGR